MSSTHTMATVPLPEMPFLNEWQGGDVVWPVQQRYHVARARERFERFLSHLSILRPEVHATFATWRQRLSPEQELRLILAPESRQAITLWRRDPATHVTFMANALAAELMLAHDARAGVGRWTALGDYYVAATAPTTAIDPRSTAWSEDQSLSAPRLSGVVPVDFLSPHMAAFTATSTVYQYAPADATVAFDNLQRGLDGIRLVSQTAYDMVCRFTQVILAYGRHDWRTQSSSSTTSYPGRIVVRNAHLATAAEAASTLIHEALHQVLYDVEDVRLFVTRSITDRIPSPWTGNPLTLHSYTHACFVWFALVQFWTRPESPVVFADSNHESELSRALKGFRTCDPVEALRPFAGVLDAGCMEAIASLRPRLCEQGLVERGR